MNTFSCSCLPQLIEATIGTINLLSCCCCCRCIFISFPFPGPISKSNLPIFIYHCQQAIDVVRCRLLSLRGPVAQLMSVKRCLYNCQVHTHTHTQMDRLGNQLAWECRSKGFPSIDGLLTEFTASSPSSQQQQQQQTTTTTTAKAITVVAQVQLQVGIVVRDSGSSVRVEF